jgi:hypothetical protein
MGIDAVEEKCWIAEYHFEVGFSSVAAVGLYQNDEDES